MESRPERRDFPTEYVVMFGEDSDFDPDREVWCRDWIAVEKAVRSSFPMAEFDAEWTELQEKFFYKSASDIGTLNGSVGCVTRSQPAFEQAFFEWRLQNAGDDPFGINAGRAAAAVPNDDSGDSACAICGKDIGGADGIECDRCGEVFCSGNCENRHGCV